MEILNDQIMELTKKSTSLEEQNSKLMSEKEQLQRQVQELMAMLGNAQGQEAPENLHKRFKVVEEEEQLVDPNEYETNDAKVESVSKNGSISNDGESSDILSSSEEEVGVLKTEKWLNQNEIFNEIKDTQQHRVTSSSKGLEKTIPFNKNSSTENISSEDRPDKFVLAREDDAGDLFSNIFGETAGNMFSQASLLTLNIVM